MGSGQSLGTATALCWQLLPVNLVYCILKGTFTGLPKLPEVSNMEIFFPSCARNSMTLALYPALRGPYLLWPVWRPWLAFPKPIHASLAHNELIFEDFDGFAPLFAWLKSLKVTKAFHRPPGPAMSGPDRHWLVILSPLQSHRSRTNRMVQCFAEGHLPHQSVLFCRVDSIPTWSTPGTLWMAESGVSYPCEPAHPALDCPHQDAHPYHS